MIKHILEKHKKDISGSTLMCIKCKQRCFANKLSFQAAADTNIHYCVAKDKETIILMMLPDIEAEEHSCYISNEDWFVKTILE